MGNNNVIHRTLCNRVRCGRPICYCELNNAPLETKKSCKKTYDNIQSLINTLKKRQHTHDITEYVDTRK